MPIYLACGQPHTTALCPPPVPAGPAPQPARVPLLRRVW